MFTRLLPLQAALTTPEQHLLWNHYHALSALPEAQALNLAQGQHAALQLYTWHASTTLALTALFLPLAARPQVAFGAHLSALPGEVVAWIDQWLNLHQMTLNLSTQAQPVYARSLKLRRLMRLAYLDLSVVMLTLADQAAALAELGQPEASREPGIWQDMEDIYLPLLHMLGYGNCVANGRNTRRARPTTANLAG